jgi:hypothetical protein
MFVTRSKIAILAKNVSILLFKSKSITKTYETRHAVLTCGYAETLDRSGTLRARALRAHPKPLKRIAWGVAVAIGISLFSPMQQVSQAQIVPTKSILKAYTRSHLTAHEYKCVSRLWGRESAWDYKADNPHSTAYGIPQLLKMKTNDPWKQINLGLKYIKHRYDRPCKALAFHDKHGWY